MRSRVGIFENFNKLKSEYEAAECNLTELKVALDSDDLKR
jgi:hypothetical protein